MGHTIAVHTMYHSKVCAIEHSTIIIRALYTQHGIEHRYSTYIHSTIYHSSAYTIYTLLLYKGYIRYAIIGLYIGSIGSVLRGDIGAYHTIYQECI